MRPWAGISGQAVDGDLAEGFGLDVPEGVVITALHPLSPFAKAGLSTGDVVLSVDDRPVNAPAEMLHHLSVRGVGETSLVTYLSKGQERAARISLIEPPEVPAADPKTLREGSLAGLTVSNLNPRIALDLRLPSDQLGVVITQIAGPLRRVGLRVGSIVTAINDVPVETSADVALLDGAQGRTWKFEGLFQGQPFMFRFRF